MHEEAPIPGCAPGIRRQDIVDAIMLAAEAIVLLCNDVGGVTDADMTVIVKLFNVPEGDIIG